MVDIKYNLVCMVFFSVIAVKKTSSHICVARTLVLVVDNYIHHFMNLVDFVSCPGRLE